MDSAASVGPPGRVRSPVASSAGSAVGPGVRPAAVGCRWLAVRTSVARSGRPTSRSRERAGERHRAGLARDPRAARSTTGATGRRRTRRASAPRAPGRPHPAAGQGRRAVACSARCCSPRTRSPTSPRSLRGTDFYRPAHETIHDAIIDLYGRGEPVDTVTVAAELQRRGELQRIGGAPYLHTLSANVPIAANAGYYAEIVREKAILRRLVDAGTKIVQIGYAGEGQVDDIVDQAQAEVYKVTDKRADGGLRPAERHHGRRPRRDRGDRQPRRPACTASPPASPTSTTSPTACTPGQMIIVAARPAMGKSTLALDLCRAASIHNNLTSVFFSLEMTRSEITMRLLSAEAKVPLNHIRNGNMNDDDWAKLARKMGEVSVGADVHRRLART